jgi:sugar/nucleoside kinase (ribokinase family)
MSLIVVGSIALDSIHTPQQQVENVLGGSATYFSFSASFFTRVRLVGVVGQDFPEQYRRLFGQKDIDLRGLETREGKTFCWRGQYQGSMNTAETLEVQLNLLEHYSPQLPQEFLDSEYVFLANGDPATQLHVLHQLASCKFSVLDTMNLWIETRLMDLKKVLKEVDCLIINDGELKQLTRNDNLIAAAKATRQLGPRYVVVKKGEHGSILAGPEGQISVLPAFPIEYLVDPTGAGDTFAGGLLGYLASEKQNVDFKAMKRAIFYATVMASFNVEDFTLNRLVSIQKEDIQKRLALFKEMFQQD